ncbi:hypothetical protein ONE63_000531 [Megalurothrips usitatus]|uniref:Uncharacterized protein n=1 Tax=Megalurothrips usitatus TaxID=439358 RepID=A0AAV7Y2I4_9NEOP|nr:hypothetical protein ONE63_000531 [Megalurothrips usitatus]
MQPRAQRPQQQQQQQQACQGGPGRGQAPPRPYSPAAAADGDIWGRMCRLAAAGPDGGGPSDYRSTRVAHQVGSFYECLKQWVCEDGVDGEPAATVRYGQASQPALVPLGHHVLHDGRGEQWELFCYLGRTTDGRTKLRIPLQALQMNGEGREEKRERAPGRLGRPAARPCAGAAYPAAGRGSSR